MRRDLRSCLCVWAAVSAVLGGCPSSTPVKQPVPPPVAVVHDATRALATSGRPTVAYDPKDDVNVLAAHVADARTAIASVTPTTLSEAETTALLARLEPMPAIDNAHAPVVRPPAAAPPRSGTPQPIAFVAPTGAAVGDRPIARPAIAPPMLAPPEILPTGEVRAESELRIRFDEPMVPVAKVDAAAGAIATFEPPIEGSWRWIDTRIAGFFAKRARFAQATDYKITVTPGLVAVSGATLQAPVSGAFSTPPARIRGIYPKGILRPDAPIAVQFDQDVDPAAIEKFLRVETLRGKQRLATTTTTLAAAKAAWAKNPSFEYDDAVLGPHYVLVAPRTPWPSGADLRAVLAKQAPSNEGPRLATTESDVQFEIARAFTLVGIECDQSDPDAKPKRVTTCPVRDWIRIAFSNEIDPRTYHADMVQLENVKADVEDNVPHGSEITLFTPATIGRTFNVKVARDITDVFGQPLVGSLASSFTTTREVYWSMLDATSGLHILDPRFEIPQWVIDAQATTALHVQLFQVQPSDYFAYEAFEAGRRATPPGKRMFDQVFPVGSRFSASARIDLRPALAGETGHVIAVATADRADGRKVPWGMNRRITAWIEVTKLGVVARLDHEKASLWAQDITPTKFLAPLPNATASLIVQNRGDLPSATTDATGHATFELPPIVQPKQGDWVERTGLLVVKSGTDSAFTTLDRYEHSVRERNARWYVTDDRFIYKPGEPVYMKGWVRWTHTGTNPGLEMPAAGDTLDYSLVDARNNKLATGTATFTDHGGFDFQVDIPKNANLGGAVFHLKTKGQTYSHPIAIEEFRTPAYSVNLDDDVLSSGALPLVVGESIEMNAEAKYYAGGGLAGAKIAWDATLSPAAFRPPGWDLFAFKPAYSRGYYGDGVETKSSQTAALSGSSASTIVYGISALANHEPAILSVDATVTDLDRATIRASSRPILVHPSSYYVGMRAAPEKLDTVQLVVTDIDGNPVPNIPIDVTIEATLLSERFRGDAKVSDTEHCSVKSSTEPVTCTWPIKNPETAFRIVARIADARGRTNATAYDMPYWRTHESERDFDLSADRKSYRPGDVAKLTVHSAMVPASAVVSFARQGVISQKRLELAKPDTLVELPIDIAFIENVHVSVDRWTKRKLDPKYQKSPLPLPDYQSTSIDLPVDVEAARLVMRTRPTRPLVQPGADATFEVEVKHADKPVAGAEVALIVVDEAVLSLSARHHQDPLEPFYSHVENGSWGVSSLGLVHDSGADVIGKPGFERINLDEMPGHGSGTGSGYGVGGGRGGMSGHTATGPTGVVTSRKDFRATAVFSPKLETDANGKVSITVKMPDSLTRFRIVALATSSTYFFGKAESTIVTQRKINARTVAPRFLTQGDRFELPVVVQNLDSTARTIDVAVRAGNLVAVGPSGRRVTVPAGQRAEVRFGFATRARGRVVIQTIAVSNDFADASNVELPVYEPATTESFATYGIVDDAPKFERLEVPAEIFADVGGIETEVASTQLQSLTDAYWYLYAYPFECAEQRSSRMLATSAMYDILVAFNMPGRPALQELDAQRALDLQKLREAQAPDGGWGYWRDTKPDAFVTMQVLQALAAQKDKGEVMKKAIANVSNQVTALFAKLELATQPTTKRSGQEAYQVSLLATGLTALAAAGVDERAAAQRLHALALRLGIYPVDVKARLLALVAKLDRAKPMRAQILGELLSSIHETAASATVAATYTEGEKLLLVSNNRTSALVLDALLREVPEHTLIPKLARGLLDARAHGRWRSTQENLAVVQAMRRYFDIYEKDTPNYTGKLWVGTAAYAEQTFAGRSNVRGVSRLDWAALVPGSGHDITLQKVGPGRMYYRIGITYAPKRTDLPALDAGFVVRRSYEAVDNPSDVVKTKDGWKIKLGAKVLVVLEAVNSARRDQVALVDPLPAGLEAVNTRLATAERAAKGTADADWDHVEMRDNRSEAFAASLREGTHRFSYTARATTPGTFIAAPTKAEEMYAPETFGRSTGATVTVY